MITYNLMRNTGELGAHPYLDGLANWRSDLITIKEQGQPHLVRGKYTYFLREDVHEWLVNMRITYALDINTTVGQQPIALLMTDHDFLLFKLKWLPYED